MDFLTRFNRHFDELTEQERKIIAYLQQNELDFSNLTSEKLAKELYVSRASIFRMLKKLELDSFAELKYLLRQSEQVRSISGKDRDFLQVVDTYHTYIDQIFDKREIVKKARLLQEADVLYLYGTGNEQKLEVEALRQLLTSLGKRVIVFFDRGEYDYVRQNFMKDDLLILISYKGEAKEAIEILKDVRLRSIRSLVFTQTSQNTMAQLADHRIYVPTESIKTPTRLTYEISTTFYFIIDQLFFECLGGNDDATAKISPT